MKKTKPIRGIRRYILLITSIFTVLIALIITAGSYFIYSRYMENSITEAAETNMKFLAAYIDKELDDIDQLVTYCKNSSTIDIFISSKTNSKTRRNDAYETLNEYCTNSSSKYLHRVVITNLFGTYIQVVAPTNSSTINVALSLEQQPFYSQLTDNEYKDYTVGFTKDPFYPRKDMTIVPILRPISYKFNSNLGGYIFIEVDEALFLDAFRNSYSEDSGILLLTMGDHTYKYEKDSFIELIEPLSEDYHIVTEPLNKAGCSVSLAITSAEAATTKIVFLSMLLVLILSLFILAVILNYVLDYVITIPVNKIRDKLTNISDGDFSRDTSIEWNHELGDIGRGVNDLAVSVGGLIDTRIANEKQKRDLEYKMLQSQINPHFIYNTLNSIKWMATVQGATGISDMTTALARLLKSISKGTKLLIPLSEELALLNDYFTIQKYRYGGTIEMITTIDDESLLQCQIIKFTLQPLVENAIFHGIEPTGRSGQIEIHLSEIDNNLVITVTDNGIGMTEEQANRILTSSDDNPSDFFKEIGVNNVQKRLQYQFGDEYGISIKSVVSEYTKMIITIPKSYEK